MTESGLTARDLSEIAAHGLASNEVARQLALLRSPPPAIRLERPATLRDGIRHLEPTDQPRLVALAKKAASTGRLSKFVPASGAATRMFQGLLEPGSREQQTFLTHLDRFPFSPELAPFAGAPSRDLVARLLDPQGLRYGELPKGLIAFHREGTAVRTAFDEHLAEAAVTVQDSAGRCCVHFTVSPEHQTLFEQRLNEARAWLPASLRLEVDFSHQQASTDTVALDESGQPFRDEGGILLFRPGGHGALLGNLEASKGDVVLIKNIDNVAPASRLAATARWKQLLTGVFLEVEAQLFAHLEALEAREPRAVEAACVFCETELGLVPEAQPTAASLRRALERPMRVCGMVPNTGEPGGGPYWVRSGSGELSLQIVESAQMSLSDPEQRALVSRATHFNPVDLVVGLRDRHGRPWSLADFVDPATAFVTEKVVEGRKLRALEHPGLWNGAMADWLTVFVEVPAATFTPVKTVFDLLRPEHQQ